MDIQPHRRPGMAIGVIDVTPVPFFETPGIDPADATMSLSDDSHAFGQINCRLADTPMDRHVIVVPGGSTEIDAQLTHAHTDLEAPQAQLANIQPAFAGTEIDDEIKRFFIVKTEVPPIVRVYVVDVMAGRFLDR